MPSRLEDWKNQESLIRCFKKILPSILLSFFFLQISTQSSTEYRDVPLHKTEALPLEYFIQHFSILTLGLGIAISVFILDILYTPKNKGLNKEKETNTQVKLSGDKGTNTEKDNETQTELDQDEDQDEMRTPTIQCEDGIANSNNHEDSPEPLQQ